MNKIVLIKIFNFGLLCILLNSCNLINPDETAPGYVEVKPFTFDPTPTLSVMGPSSSTKIKDVWVFVDNEFQGAYELPARFPILKTGSHRMIFSPGIALNGISSTRTPYPFYQSQISQVDIPANGTVTINPSCNYYQSVACPYSEFFEGSGFAFSPTAQSDTTMSQLPVGNSNVFEGNSSGVVYLDDTNSKFEITTTSDYQLPNGNAAVFLEMDYKINQSMQVGLFVIKPFVSDEQIPVITLNPTAVWKKIYIQLGYVVSSYNSDTRFKIYFGAIKDPSVPKPTFYLDNVKVVHF